MHLLPFHVGEDILDFSGAGHEERVPRDILHRRLRAREQSAQDVLGVHDPDDVVKRLAGDRVAGPPCRGDAIGGLRE